MSNPESLEQVALQKLIAQAERLGVTDQVPQVLIDHAGHQFNGGAIAWTRTHPDDQTLYGCCWGETINGGERCTCWIPEYDLDQQPCTPPADGQMQPRATMCGDCAYRPGSPELSDPLLAPELLALPLRGGVFFCHDGIRRPKLWRHPDGRTVPGAAEDYQPPFDETRRPYRADGTVAAICAGWAARGRAIQNDQDKKERNPRP